MNMEERGRLLCSDCYEEGFHSVRVKQAEADSSEKLPNTFLESWSLLFS